MSPPQTDEPAFTRSPNASNSYSSLYFNTLCTLELRLSDLVPKPARRDMVRWARGLLLIRFARGGFVIGLFGVSFSIVLGNALLFSLSIACVAGIVTAAKWHGASDGILRFRPARASTCEPWRTAIPL